jgi:CRP-like cAMP-binding protein
VEQKLALLSRVPSIFDDVEPDELRKMAAATEWVTALSGGEMVTQGDLGDAMFIVASGSLDATIRDIGPVKSYGPHDFFGEQGLAGPVGGV